MKKLFIEAKDKKNIIPIVKKAVKLLKGKIGLVSTIQHSYQLEKAKDFLEKNNIKAVVGGNILGCNAGNAVKIKNKVDMFLYVGSGEFHPIQIALETEKKVIIANPLSGKVNELDKSEITKIKQRRKGALLRFLSSKNIGILVSLKSGQNRLNDAFELKKKLKEKNCYIFAADTLDLNQLENFPFVEAWVNTACPRIVDDKKGIVNIDEI